MNKFVVITGGTKGIGRAIVQKFARNGFDIITCARNKQDLENLRSEFQTKHAAIHVQQVDVSNPNEIKKFIQFIQKIQKNVDILINNAGVFLPGQIHTEEEGILEQMLNTNLHSAYHLTRGLVGAMIQQAQGHIFNICSTASIMPYINGGSYCISKYALLGMTKVLREELKDKGIKVTAVLPGATLTASWEGADLPPERFMKPEDVADAIFNTYQLSANSVVEEILIRPQLGDL